MRDTHEISAHSAPTRRRRQRFAVTGVFVAAVAAAAAIGASQFGGSATIPNRGSTSVAHVQLVAYKGEQPTGFKVSTVPDGWQVISSTPTAFVVQPLSPGGQSAGEIWVSLQGLSHFPSESPVKKVDINGRTGELGHPLSAPGKLSATRWLFFSDASGRKVQVTVEEGVNLSDEQVVDFAKGITVTDHAVEVGG